MSSLPSLLRKFARSPSPRRDLGLIPLTGLRSAGIKWNPREWFVKGDNESEDEDPTPPEDLVPTSWWTIGLGLSIILCVAILAKLFKMNVGEAILALILGFLFSFIGVQSAGTTDVNPVSTVAKVRELNQLFPR